MHFSLLHLPLLFVSIGGGNRLFLVYCLFFWAPKGLMESKAHGKVVSVIIACLLFNDSCYLLRELLIHGVSEVLI